MVSLSQKRIRRHCNPFHVRHFVPKPEWEKIFKKQQPLEVELGFGKASFLIDRALKNPSHNFVGIELRGQLVELAKQHAVEKQIDNIFFIFGNIHLVFENIFDDHSINIVHLHFPDPWFKNRHRNRRMLNQQMIHLFSNKMSYNATLYIQTDVKELAQEMDRDIQKSGLFLKQHSQTFLELSPFDSVSDWELYHQKRGNPIYRLLYTIDRKLT